MKIKFSINYQLYKMYRLSPYIKRNKNREKSSYKINVNCKKSNALYVRRNKKG